MTFKRVGVLLIKELLHGSKSFILIFAVVAPLMVSLFISLAFGTVFSEKAKLGFADEGNSRIVGMARELESLSVLMYSDVSSLKEAASAGIIDVGIVLPADFDRSIQEGKQTEMTGYVWGESMARNRVNIAIALTNFVRIITGQDSPVDIKTITLGNEVSMPWSDRLLPLLVLMAIFVAGSMLPATSIVNEKEKRTINAMLVTPTTIGEIFISKGVFGAILSLIMGILILVINQAFTAEPVLLVMVLLLGAIMAATIGLLLGVLLKDFNTLYAVWKSGLLLLIAPVFIYLFPQIPEWVGMIFPTYYVVQPIVDISIHGLGWPDIALNVFILIGLNLLLIGAVKLALSKTNQYVI